MPIGIGKTTAGRSGNVPQVNITGYHREVQKRLFYSRREQALILEKTVRGGFGILEMGQVMTQVHGVDYIVPYGAGGQSAIASNASAGQNKVLLALSEQYKFAAGEAVTVVDDNENENAVIDTAEVSGEYFALTLESVLSNSYTTAADGYVKHRAGSNLYVMDQEIDCGDDNNALEGALTSVVISNAVLYQDAVIGMDNTALTFLNGLEDGIFYVIR